MCAHTGAPPCTCMHTEARTRSGMHTCIHMHTHSHTSAHMLRHVRTHTNTHTHGTRVHTCQECTQAHIHANRGAHKHVHSAHAQPRTHTRACKQVKTEGTHQGEKRAETRDPSHTEGAPWWGTKVESLAADMGSAGEGGPCQGGQLGRTKAPRRAPESQREEPLPPGTRGKDRTRGRTVPASIPPCPVSRCHRSIGHAPQGAFGTTRRTVWRRGLPAT